MLIDRARTINNVMGYGMIEPWAVDHLPDDWLYVFEGLTRKLPSMRGAIAEVEMLKNKWRQEYKQRYMQ